MHRVFLIGDNEKVVVKERLSVTEARELSQELSDSDMVNTYGFEPMPLYQSYSISLDGKVVNY